MGPKSSLPCGAPFSRSAEISSACPSTRARGCSFSIRCSSPGSPPCPSSCGGDRYTRWAGLGSTVHSSCPIRWSWRAGEGVGRSDIRVVGRVAVGDSSWLRSRRIPRSARPVREPRRDRVADVSGAHGVQMAWRPAAPLSTPRGEPCCARQSVPHPTASLYAVVYFWDFKSYWTYPPNVVAFALVAALLTIGALPVSHTPARGVNGWPTLAQSIRQMVMAASASVDRAVFPRVTSPVDMRQMSH